MRKIASFIEFCLAGLRNSFEFRNQVLSSRESTLPTESSANKHTGSFKNFVFVETKNRKYLVIAICGTIIQFTIFKFFYPFPDFISDSYSYIATNLNHMDVNLWPIGYSKFLLGVHMISHSDIFLVAIQYLLLEVSLAYFFYSVLYLFAPGKIVSIILYIFLFFNPLFIFLSNAVLSDALFAALTIVFLTEFIWMLHRPKITQVIIQGIIVGLCFTIRYTAIYYPLISLVGLLLSRHRLIIKLAGFSLCIALMVPFYIYTTQKTKEVTGTAEFSVFGGWQLANNALYMYDHITVDTNSLPTGTLLFDRMVRKYFASVPAQYRELNHFPGTFFIKHLEAPLKQYMFRHVEDSTWGFRAWGQVSPIYNSYGSYLIRSHPIEFARYYLLMNAKNYLVPHLEKFGSYNIGMDSVYQDARTWFQYKSPSVRVASKNFQGDLFFIYPTLFLLFNAFFIVAFIQLIITGKYKTIDKSIIRTLLLCLSFLLFNFVFSVFATPIVLRYQIVPMIILLTFYLLEAEALHVKTKESPVILMANA